MINVIINKNINFLKLRSILYERCLSIHSKYTSERHKQKIQDNFTKNRINWYNIVNELPTIEQRLVELNLQKLHKYNCTYFNDSEIPINGLKFAKFVTRTHIEHKLPQSYHDEDSHVDEICKDLEDEIKENIVASLGNKRCNVGQFFSNVNLLLIRKLQDFAPHLKDSSTDYDVSIDAFWFFGHSDHPKSLQEFIYELRLDRMGWYSDNPIRAHLQPNLVLRTKMPLGEATEPDNELSCGQNIEYCGFKPSLYGYEYERKRAVIIPGYLPGVTNEHGYLFFYDMNSLKEFRNKYGDAYISLAHQQRAITAGFAQAFSHAFIQGATPFRDPDRPVTQQSVFSDGKLWVFSIYQLNICDMSLKNGLHNDKNNVLWLDEPVQMYDTIENDKVMGYNSGPLKTLIKMYLRKTVDVPEPNGMRFVMNHNASKEFKDEFHRQFLLMISEEINIKSKQKEIAMWEKIYKLWHKDRPRDAKRKFFELPWRRTPDHLKKFSSIYPKYIPRILRVDKQVARMPRINSELLMEYDQFVLKKNLRHTANWPLLKNSIGLKETTPLGDPYLIRDH